MSERITPAQPARRAYDDRSDRAFFWGALWGMLIGALVAAWNSQQSGKALRARLLGRGQAIRQAIIGEVEQAAQQVRRQIEGESIEESLAAGKAEARRLNQASQANPANPTREG